jgi:hypothetical protein
MAQVIPMRPHTFRVDNCIIDTYAAEMGAIGVAMYAVLQRYADRATGQCWPSVATIARLLDLSKNCVKKYLHRLVQLGLLTSAPRTTAEGDPTSNLYTLPDPTQPASVLQRRQEGEASGAGGGAPGDLPPQANRHQVPEGGAPGGPKQDLPEQETITSPTTSKTLTLQAIQNTPALTIAEACTHPAQPHWAPTSDLLLCTECFRCWTPAPTVPAAAPVTSVEAQPLACRG